MLTPILKELSGRDDVMYIIDERMDVNVLKNHDGVVRVRPTILSRLKNEFDIKGVIKNAKHVLCMGNLPPLFARNDETIVFVQNRYLLDESIRNRLSIYVRIRLWLEKFWLRMHCDSVKLFVVQTRTMAELLNKTYNRRADIIPIVPENYIAEDDHHECEKKYDFLYVASGEEHKNHINLVNAWVELAGMGLHPKLCLTISKQRFPGLYKWIEHEKHKHGLDITNVGELVHDEIQKYYRFSMALIYPSLFESFGLPLIEAVVQGIPVLAADKDYVHDLLANVKTFNPTSPKSIAEAVAGFSYEEASLIIEPCSAQQFLEKTVLGTH